MNECRKIMDNISVILSINASIICSISVNALLCAQFMLSPTSWNSMQKVAQTFKPKQN